MAIEDRIQHLQKGGGNNRGKGKKFYNGVIFRDCFTEDDVKALAQTFKDFINDKEQKTSDRIKAAEIVLKYIVDAGEETEQTETLIKDVNDFKSMLAQLVASTDGLQEIQQG